MCQINLLKMTVFIILILCSILTFALQEDSKEKIYINADSTLYNYKNGRTIYEGNVTVDQGTSHITADKLITELNSRHKIKQATAYGLNKSAQYWTVPHTNELEMHASAKIIKFYPSESNIVLEQNAFVTQGENSFQGQLILYNRKDQTVFVPATNTGRAIVVYNPDTKK